MDARQEPARESPVHGTQRQDTVRVRHNSEVSGRVPWQREEAEHQRPVEKGGGAHADGRPRQGGFQ